MSRPESRRHAQLAFPAGQAAGSSPHSHGLTVLEYFAARAPAEVPAWFEPDMGPRPQVPSLRELDPATRRDVETADDCGADPETIAGCAYVAARDSAKLTLEVWKAQRERERVLQWPWAWASAVLARKP